MLTLYVPFPELAVVVEFCTNDPPLLMVKIPLFTSELTTVSFPLTTTEPPDAIVKLPALPQFVELVVETVTVFPVRTSIKYGLLAL
jgi:hypothetical protein